MPVGADNGHYRVITNKKNPSKPVDSEGFLMVGAKGFEPSTTRTPNEPEYHNYLILLGLSSPNLPFFALFFIFFPTFFRHENYPTDSRHMVSH